MAEEFDIDLDLETPDENQERINKVEKRIKDLSEKVKLTAQERDELGKAKEALEAEKAGLAKEVEFFKNFNSLTAKYQGAAEVQEKVLEKYKAGYDIEDAVVSELVKAGKFQASAPAVPTESPAGGSAANNIQSGADKPLSEMSQEERRAALSDREGDLLKIFNQSL